MLVRLLFLQIAQNQMMLLVVLPTLANLNILLNSQIFASSYTTELIAIMLVIKYVLYLHSGNNFTIFMESKSALIAFQKFYPNTLIINL